MGDIEELVEAGRLATKKEIFGGLKILDKAVDESDHYFMSADEDHIRVRVSLALLSDKDREGLDALGWHQEQDSYVRGIG